jgi:CDP-diglyceride synthetase
VELVPAEITIHVVFLLGVVLVVIFAPRNRKSEVSSRKKFFWYYLIVQVVFIATMNRAAFTTLAGVIAAGGSVEMLRLKKSVLPLVVFLPAAAGLICFALKAELDTIRLCYTVVAIFDFASEIGGRVRGHTAIMPAVSPGKTVEGLGAGIFTVFAAAAVLGAANFFTAAKPSLIAALSAGAAFAGDALASLCKRQNGIKDFSDLIPAQGGVLDRFDSFILSAAVLFVVL